MSDRHPNQAQATREQQRDMQMAASPVPRPGQAAPAVQLQQPEYPPDILPIYILKTDPQAAAAAVAAAVRATPPPPKLEVANVDDPTQPPNVPTPDKPASELYAPAPPVPKR